MKNSQYVKFLFLIIVISVFIVACQGASSHKGPQAVEFTPTKNDVSIIKQAYSNRTSNLFVESNGIVERLLSDDLKGSRHQRFIIRLSSGQTLLIAHNIDIAPRIDSIAQGDRVDFRGEYEWNEKGGVVHWTHHDPGGRKLGGWIVHNGFIYK